MQAGSKRNIQSGEGYSHLFPQAEGENKTIRRNADVTHTVAFIPRVVHETLHHTKGIAQKLKANNSYETCANIWHFVYRHIAYRKDQEGYEQIRNPARTWHDRRKGVDCDCYSVFISSILTNLHIPHILRITKYHRDHFQHIYPVVTAHPPTSRSGGIGSSPSEGGHEGTREREIVMDCVTDQFNYEVPYSEKKDYPMDLQYLNGFDGDEMGQLYGRKKKAAPVHLPAKTKKPSLLQKLKPKALQKPKQASVQQAAKPKNKGVLKKALNKINKVNPSTVLLRNGMLAAMKLNVKNVASRLRWTYLSPQQAQQKGIDPAKFARLVATRQKLEKIFYGAGGNEKNLKAAILGGKGNKDRAVLAGLEGVGDSTGIEHITAYTPLQQLLGPQMYRSENIEGMEGFAGLGQLGEPMTLASVGAAMGVIAGIVASLKQIGGIFNKKGEGAKDFDPATNEAAENNAPVPGTTQVPEAEAKEAAKDAIATAQEKQTATNNLLPTSSNTASNTAVTIDEYTPTTNDNSVAPIDNNIQEIEAAGDTITNESVHAVATTTTGTGAITPPVKKDYWEDNKSWLKPAAIGAGCIGLLAIGMAVLKPNTTTKKSGSSKTLSGVPKTQKKKAHHRKPKKPKSHPKKTAVALL